MIRNLKHRMQDWEEISSRLSLSRFTEREREKVAEGAKRIKHRRWQPLLHTSPREEEEEDPFQLAPPFRPCFLLVLRAPRARNEHWILETENMGGRRRGRWGWGAQSSWINGWLRGRKSCVGFRCTREGTVGGPRCINEDKNCLVAGALPLSSSLLLRVY